jgi:hypothetical protein
MNKIMLQAKDQFAKKEARVNITQNKRTNEK